MPSTLAHSTRTGSWLRVGQTVAAISLLFGGAALAQTANGGGVQSAKVQAAYADWRRLSQTEVNCVDQSLRGQTAGDRKSTRLNSSHQIISYAVFCLKKKTYHTTLYQL